MKNLILICVAFILFVACGDTQDSKNAESTNLESKSVESNANLSGDSQTLTDSTIEAEVVIDKELEQHNQREQAFAIYPAEMYSGEKKIPSGYKFDADEGVYRDMLGKIAYLDINFAGKYGIVTHSCIILECFLSFLGLLGIWRRLFLRKIAIF